jgi:exopolyphosphatase/guanosine-5'-triphosphate,3'-diphosphate pyrophosphatase
MRAAVDVGTNTVRLLLGEERDGRVVPDRYYRRITRLGGGFTSEMGLSPQAMERTLSALTEIGEILRSSGVNTVRAVGTAALREAPNGVSFAEKIRSAARIPLEIIDGIEEATLCARGVLSALSPRPDHCLIFDIGGGSTEFILTRGSEPIFQRSYPLGVVRLCEQVPSLDQQTVRIGQILERFQADLAVAGWERVAAGSTLVGTAGTVTTLAALQLEMTQYDWRRVNNLVLGVEDLKRMASRLAPLSSEERESLPGMEKGRGDLILPGLGIVLGILEHFGRSQVTASDFGLLEGALLSLGNRGGQSN